MRLEPIHLRSQPVICIYIYICGLWRIYKNIYLYNYTLYVRNYLPNQLETMQTPHLPCHCTAPLALFVSSRFSILRRMCIHLQKPYANVYISKQKTRKNKWITDDSLQVLRVDVLVFLCCVFFFLTTRTLAGQWTWWYESPQPRNESYVCKMSTFVKQYTIYWTQTSDEGMIVLPFVCSHWFSRLPVLAKKRSFGHRWCVWQGSPVYLPWFL